MIELIVVIVILGILAAIAVPKIVSLSDEATDGTLKMIAASAGTAMQMNQGGCAAVGQDSSGTHAATCRRVRYCDDAYALLTQQLNTAEYSITHDDLGAVNNVTGDCVVTHISSGTQQTFKGITAGNP